VAPTGTVVSLVAIGRCTWVTTTGLRWNLARHDLVFSPYGVHNEVAQSPASVSVESGDLLLFRGRWIEKHV
jgi:thiamine pyrophosphokinase